MAPSRNADKTVNPCVPNLKFNEGSAPQWNSSFLIVGFAWKLNQYSCTHDTFEGKIHKLPHMYMDMSHNMCVQHKKQPSLLWNPSLWHKVLCWRYRACSMTNCKRESMVLSMVMVPFWQAKTCAEALVGRNRSCPTIICGARDNCIHSRTLSLTQIIQCHDLNQFLS